MHELFLNPNGQVTLEVVKHLDLKRVRAISLQSTDGLQRGLEVTDTGKQIEVPVGPEVLGNIFNVLGKTLNDSEKKFSKYLPIHRQAPPFTEYSTHAPSQRKVPQFSISIAAEKLSIGLFRPLISKQGL